MFASAGHGTAYGTSTKAATPAFCVGTGAGSPHASVYTPSGETVSGNFLSRQEGAGAAPAPAAAATKENTSRAMPSRKYDRRSIAPGRYASPAAPSTSVTRDSPAAGAKK